MIAPELMLRPADLPGLGFTLTRQDVGRGISYWAGHRLSVEIGPVRTHIKMLGCGCPLITAPAYPLAKMEMLVAALNLSAA